MKYIERALRGSAVEYSFILPKRNNKDLDLVLKKYNKYILKQIKTKLIYRKGIKFQINVNCKLTKEKHDGTGNKVSIQPWFPSKTQQLISKYHLQGNLNVAYREIKNLFEGFITQGSGWILNRILKIKLSLAQIRPLSGGCEKHDLPVYIKNKKCCKSFKCNDNKCFLYCLISALFYKNGRVMNLETSRFLFSRFKCGAIDFPVSVAQIPIFEKHNRILSINVFGSENKASSVFAIYLSKFNGKRKKHVNLLLYRGHYYLITNFSRLMACQLDKSGKNKRHFCMSCLFSSLDQNKLRKHMNICKTKTQQFTTPKRKTYMSFEHYHNVIKGDFVIYFDIEAINCPFPDGGKNRSPSGKTVKTSIHIPISVAAIRISSCTRHSSDIYLYRGYNCIKQFWEYLESEHLHIMNLREFCNYKIAWNEQSREQFNSAEFCEACGLSFKEKHLIKCADHSHICPGIGCCENTNYRAALCGICNLKYAIPTSKIPVCSHNFKNYDNHHILSELYKYAHSTPKIIARSSEKYLTMETTCFKFFDTLEFLSTSLEILSHNLLDKGPEYFYYTNENLIKGNMELNNLVFQKGVMCYSHINNIKVLAETELPPPKAFYNELKQEEITREEYKRAQKTWKLFNCQNLEEYMDVYLKMGVLLLADIF